MFNEALKEVKNLVFETNLDGDLEKTVGEIAKEHKIAKKRLMPYFNAFSLLKINLDKRTDITDTTKNFDWTDQEIEIVMMYMEDAKKEKQGVTEAFENLANLIFKTPSGIQYKYYEVKRKLKEGLPLKKGTRGRKKKVLTTNEVVTPVATKEEETKTTASVEDIIEDRKERMKRREKQQQVVSSVVEQQPTTNVEPKKQQDTLKLISGLINNFKILGETKNFNANQELNNLFNSLYKISLVAIEKTTNTTMTKQNVVQQPNDSFMENFQELKRNIEQFATLDGVEQLTRLEEHNRTQQDILNKLENISTRELVKS